MNTPVISSFESQPSAIHEPQIRLQTLDEKPVAEQSVQPVRSGAYLVPGAALTIFILLLLGFTTYKITDPETLPIKNVGVAGEFSHLSPAALQGRVSDVVRGGFFSVNVDMIQEALLQEPWIQEVSVKRVWPDRITVTIREQVPIARWGEAGLLNAEAEIFSPDPATFPASLPVLSGPGNTSRQVMDSFRRIQDILPAGIRLQQLTLSERRSWELKLENGPVIRLGKTAIIKRLQKLLEFLPADNVGSMDQIEYIDMRYTNGFALMKKIDNRIQIESVREKHGEKI
jgi:cell division protein FtsQ